MDLQKEIMDLQKDHAETSASTKSAHKRLDTLEGEIKDIRRLTVAVEKIADKTENIEEKVDGLSVKLDVQDKRVTDIECKPAKRWDGAVDTIIKVIIGGIISFFLFKLGIGA